MTLTRTDTKIVYEGDGSQLVFPIPFPFGGTSEIHAILVDKPDPDVKTETPLVPGADFTVMGSELFLMAPLGVTQELLIKRVSAHIQEIDISDTGPFPAEQSEGALDKLTMIAQEQQEELDRAVKLSPTSDAETPVFPDPVADTFLTYGDSGLELMTPDEVRLKIGASSDTDVADHLQDTDNPHATTADQVGAPTLDEFHLHLDDQENPHGVTAEQVGSPTTGEFQAHLDDQTNPHGVTTAQIGAATKVALDAHIADHVNPHGVTADQVGRDAAQWNADRILGYPVDPENLADGMVLGFNETTGNLEFMEGGEGGGGGTLMTASNIGASGTGVFKRRNLLNFEFKKLNPTSGNVLVEDNTGTDTVDIDLPITGQVVGTTDAQTLSGKEFAQDIVPDANNTRSIGTSSKRFKDGFFQGDVLIAGDLEVSGTTRTVNQETLNVENSEIHLNVGGTDFSAEGGGIKVEGAGGAVLGSIGYMDDAESKFSAGAPGDESEIVTVGHTQKLSQKQFADGLTMDMIPTPDTPWPNQVVLYPKPNGKLYTLDGNDVEREVGAQSGSTFSDGIRLVETDAALVPLAGEHIIRPKTDGKLYHTLPDGTEKPLGSGAGGGSSIKWIEGSASPLPAIEDFIEKYLFAPGEDQSLYAMIAVPSGYEPGSPIKIRLKFHTDFDPPAHYDFKLATNKVEWVPATSPPKFSQVQSFDDPDDFNDNMASRAFDLVDPSGKIGSALVYPGETLMIRLSREPDTTDQVVKFLPHATEVIFA